jgi:2-(1,2-epoxy-1,2-dihydrophenyl)acetyl-CoA isomerase
MGQYRDLDCRTEGAVRWIVLDKADRLNAISWSTMAELESAVAEAERDDAVRVVVVTGKGRGFCSGMDLGERLPEAEWSPRPEEGRAGLSRSRHLFTARIYHCRKPVIAAVNGVAAGAGLSLALACDIRLASSAARFSAIFLARGTVADTGCTWHLPRVVGMEQAKRMLWTGRMVPAEEALAMGLVSEVVPADELDARATTVAEEIAAGPAVAIEMDKRLVHESLFTTLDQQIEREELAFRMIAKTADFKEGSAAFYERREPRFEGR